jgi:putative transposase
MIVHRGFKFKLYPTPEQEEKFRQFAGVCRLVYNLAWEQRQIWGRSHKLGYLTQARELKNLRAQFNFIGDVAQQCEQQALRDLDDAFKRFFRKESGYPSPRKKGRNDTFRFQGREIRIEKLNTKWSRVILPKIGWVKLRHTRDIRGKICNATVSLTPLGWHVSFTNEIEISDGKIFLPSVGIDRGVANTLTLSTGEMMSLPKNLDALDKRYRQAQRTISRRKKGSKRRLRAIKKAARISAKRARIRKDWHHKASRSIADRFGTVVMEDLKISNMTASAKGTIKEPGRNVRQKAGLNRSILNQGWCNFGIMLKYKLEERGGEIVTVDPRYTSQTCSSCGTVDRDSRKSQAVFSCDHCGFVEHADINAAINILRRWNTPCLDVEEGSCPSCEASTTGENALNPAA